MNILRNNLAIMSVVVLSLGFALPAAALHAEGAVDSATHGTVQVGATTLKTNTSVGADLGVGGSADTQSSSTTSDGNAQGTSSADASVTMEANTTVSIQPLIVTRADVDAGSVRAIISSPSAVTTRADLSGYVAAEMKADKNISSVEAASDNVAVTYKQNAKLFGFIPVTVDATANVDAEGNVTVSYPWYAFLMMTNKSDLQATIQNRVTADANLAASTNVTADASAEAAGQLSADAQARIVAAVKAAMQAEFNASINASADGTVSVR